MGSKSGYFEQHQEGCPKVSVGGGDCNCPAGAVTVFPPKAREKELAELKEKTKHG